MSLVLIGFSGTGKSTVGQLVADRLGLEFLDTDLEVERRAGKRIHEIFAEDGEAAFRRLESEVVRRALQGGPRVVAVGGGAVMDPLNRSAMKEGHLVVLLEATEDTIEARLAADLSDEPRPLLAGGRAQIEALKATRDPVYRETADLVVCTDGADVEHVAAMVVDAARNRLSYFGEASRGEL